MVTRATRRTRRPPKRQRRMQRRRPRQLPSRARRMQRRRTTARRPTVPTPRVARRQGRSRSLHPRLRPRRHPLPMVTWAVAAAARSRRRAQRRFSASRRTSGLTKRRRGATTMRTHSGRMAGGSRPSRCWARSAESEYTFVQAGGVLECNRSWGSSVASECTFVQEGWAYGARHLLALLGYVCLDLLRYVFLRVQRQAVRKERTERPPRVSDAGIGECVWDGFRSPSRACVHTMVRGWARVHDRW
mmetsp:Transcript_31692/g.94451  ORF Transcript_31692/g.94451 Transcript_31692/m.94451 type:complete len:245 (-) Transcript_31692:527-1261(-)